MNYLPAQYLPSPIIHVQEKSAMRLFDGFDSIGRLSSALLRTGITGRIDVIGDIRPILGELVSWSHTMANVDGKEVNFGEEAKSKQVLYDTLGFSIDFRSSTAESRSIGAHELVAVAVIRFDSKKKCFSYDELLAELGKSYERNPDHIDIFSSSYIIENSKHSKTVVIASKLDPSRDCLSSYAIAKYKIVL